MTRLPDALDAYAVADETLSLQASRTFPAALLWRAESFRSSAGQPMTLRRAAALNAILERCDLPIQPGELLLGSGLGRFTIDPIVDPELLGDARRDLDAIGSRSFATHADHHAPDTPVLLRLGLPGLIESAQTSLRRHADPNRRAFLDSIVLALSGASRHLMRWADLAERLATEGGRFAPLLAMQSRMLRDLTDRPPRTLHEALQLAFMFHSIFQLDDRYAMALGRIDQHLHPFYRSDLQNGRITPDDARLLLRHLFAKLAHRTDIQNVCVGGVDRDGMDATNDLSFLCVEAAMAVGRPGANLTARIHSATPEPFLHLCSESIRAGTGFPALYNDDIEIPALAAQGFPIGDARDYCFVGCIEVFFSGRQAPWSDSRFNFLRCVDLTLRDGMDGLTGRREQPEMGEPATWDSFFHAFLQRLRNGLRRHIEGIDAIERSADNRAGDLTSPLLSALTADCIERGRDLNDGGALYPAHHGVAGMGIGSAADSLAAIRRFVYERHRMTLSELRRLLDADFNGAERDRLLLLSAPKYGNDDPEVDSIAARIAKAFGEELSRYRTPRGGRYWGLLAANVQNVSSGREVGASSDGRRARQPLSDAASPSFGRDRHGPTAVIRSVSRIDYRDAPGGNVVNLKLHPTALSGEAGIGALSALVRACFDLGGIQLQFNATDRETLRDAVEHPERHRDLVVRVSGFSAYFVTLDRAVQEDIIARTEHGTVGAPTPDSPRESQDLRSDKARVLAEASITDPAPPR